MKSFQITIDIRATRINNPFDMKVTREIDVDDDRNLDEIMDVPIGKLILGSAYVSRYDYTAPADMCSNCK